jgi:AcrR family transcriptional regulator
MNSLSMPKSRLKKSKRGRRPGTPVTALVIRRAAARAFAERGYTGVTMREIAASAGVDAALIHHYFGTKRALFEAAIELADVAKFRTLVPSKDDLPSGEELVRVFLERWDIAAEGDTLPALLRASASDSSAAAAIDALLERDLIAPTFARIDATRGMPKLRSGLIGAQLLGLAWMRYVARLEPIASASSRIVAKAFGPSLDATLVGRDYGASASGGRPKSA